MKETCQIQAPVGAQVQVMTQMIMGKVAQIQVGIPQILMNNVIAVTQSSQLQSVMILIVK